MREKRTEKDESSREKGGREDGREDGKEEDGGRGPFIETSYAGGYAASGIQTGVWKQLLKILRRASLAGVAVADYASEQRH